MKIAIITCHDVYNCGASLQVFALQTYFVQLGHEVEIIDYKPEYLSRHYSLFAVNNSSYDYPLIREVYLLAKLPTRIRRLSSTKKKAFDSFRETHLRVTKRRYRNIHDLQKNCPYADLYIAGSDQIWNPLFQNGKDPAFFLQFVNDKAKRGSYAASFSVERLSESDSDYLKRWLKDFRFLSVREQSAVNILEKMGLSSVQVCDPVFLLADDFWKSFLKYPGNRGYIFIYDFDQSPILLQIAKKLARRDRREIIRYFPGKDTNLKTVSGGPVEFLGLLANADIVLTNSFHAIAFSLLFHREFYAFPRKENINCRIVDLLERMNLQCRMVYREDGISRTSPIDWNQTDRILEKEILLSKAYIDNMIKEITEGMDHEP